MASFDPVRYDTTQPRVSVSYTDPVSYEHSERELGQGNTMGEAMFFLSIGYAVHVAVWNGRCYESQCNYLPGDL